MYIHIYEKFFILKINLCPACYGDFSRFIEPCRPHPLVGQIKGFFILAGKSNVWYESSRICKCAFLWQPQLRLGIAEELFYSQELPAHFINRHKT